MSIPAVSVAMPVYNGEKYLAESIESILTQTFTDFEYIIIDDGSTDATLSIIKEYAARDSRIRYAVNEKNAGRGFSRNRAFELARAPLIALMDADDLVIPERLAIQYAYMQAHPEVDVLSGCLENMKTGKKRLYDAQGEKVRVLLLFNCCLAQPVVMLKKEALQAVGGYADMNLGEDYDLWLRFADAGYRMDVIPQGMMCYRTQPEVARTEYKYGEITTTSTFYKRQLARLGIHPSRRQLDFPACHPVRLCADWRAGAGHTSLAGHAGGCQ